jgi:hypothetical protein
MPAPVVSEAFKTHLGDPWTDGIPVGDLDRWSTPPTDVNAFLVVQYPVVNGVRAVIGRTFFEEGAARMVLNVKREVGIVQGRVWGKALADLFRSTRFSGVETFAPDGPIEDDNIDDGNWLSFAVIVPYRYQFQG